MKINACFLVNIGPSQTPTTIRSLANLAAACKIISHIFTKNGREKCKFDRIEELKEPRERGDGRCVSDRRCRQEPRRRRNLAGIRLSCAAPVPPPPLPFRWGLRIEMMMRGNKKYMFVRIYELVGLMMRPRYATSDVALYKSWTRSPLRVSQSLVIKFLKKKIC